MAVKQYPSKLLGQNTWGYNARIKGRRVQQTGFGSKEAAELALAKRRIAANERAAGVRAPADPITLKAVVESRVKQLGEATVAARFNIKILRRWLAMLPPGLTAQQLATAHLTPYRDARLKQVKPQTVNRELSEIMACLNSAHERHAELADWQAPRRPKLKVPKGFRSAIITPEQIRALLTDLRRPKEDWETRPGYRARLDAADFFQVALLTLGRKTEVRTLNVRDINWERKRLRIDSVKTDTRGEIEMPDGLIEILKRRLEAHDPPSLWVFPSPRDPTRPIAALDLDLLRSSAKHLGIPWGYADPHGIVLHTTRHTAVSALLAAGHDLPTVQAKSRHSTRQMLMRYAHATRASEAAATHTLDQFSVANLAAIAPAAAAPVPHEPRRGHQ